MNKIYQYVEDPETNTKRIKCDLCDNTYSHHPALRYHRLREHGKFPIARKKPQRRNSSRIEYKKTASNQVKQHVVKDEAIASDNLKSENDLDLEQDTKILIADLANNTFGDDDETSVEEDELLNKNPCKTRYIYQSVVDPVTKKKRIKCDLCENTYSHHPALRNHRLKAHGKFPIGRKSRKVFSNASCDSNSMNNEENIKDINEIKEFNNEHLNIIKEDSELGDANFEEFLSVEDALTSQSVSSVNDLLLNEIPKIEYVEFPSNSLNDETNAEENIYIKKSLQANDECIQTCGVIKFSMDYTIFNINCFYCDDIFPLGSWEEFVTHLKELHQREEESLEEVEKPLLDSMVSYSNKEFTLKIEIDHEALNKSANWQSDINSPLDEINKTDSEDDYLKELEYKPIDEIPKATCDICKKTFRSEYRLKIHHRSRHNNGNFPDRRLAPRHCTICNKTFKHPSFYRKHINVHNPPRFKCNICDKEYRWKHSFNEHLKVHENQRDHVCELCGDSFLSYSRLRNHTKLKHADDKAYVCVICEYACKTSMELWLHRRSNHLVLEGTIEELNKNLNEQTLSVEDNKDDNEAEEITVKSTEELESEHADDNEEVKEDNDELNFKSIKTNKRKTKAKKSLTVSCPLCENFFRDEENLQNHQYRVHHVKRFDLADRHCNICNRTFKLPSMYRNHLAVHKPPSFKCQTCGKEFRWRKSLTDHMKIHANQRDHICELCGAGFFHNIRLRDHKKMWHFDEKNYSCSFCEYTCKTATQLCQHRKKFHILEEELNKKSKKKYPSQRKPKGSRAPKYQYVVDPDTKVKLLKCDLCDNTYSHHPALRYHRFNEHGKIPIQSRKTDQQKEYKIESTLEQEVIDLLTSENQSDIAEQEEIIHFPDDLIVYDATEEV